MEWLKLEKILMKQRYSNRFPDDILHINELLTNIYHQIYLKDANLVISCRQYDCPKKYQEV